MNVLSALKEQARRIRPLVACVRAVRIATDPLQRSAWIVSKRQPDLLMQPFTTTCVDRHPALFEAIRRELRSIARPRILSYGCATGEEALTLARYLPGSTITAVDINPVCIARARRKLREVSSADIALKVVASPNAFPAESFDAVVCLSVLRHGKLAREAPDQCSAIMPFSKYDSMIRNLDRVLRPGGVLALWGSNFLFCETSTSAHYVVLMTVPGGKTEPRYGRDDRRVCASSEEDCLFRKINGIFHLSPVNGSGSD